MMALDPGQIYRPDTGLQGRCRPGKRLQGKQRCMAKRALRWRSEKKTCVTTLTNTSNTAAVAPSHAEATHLTARGHKHCPFGQQGEEARGGTRDLPLLSSDSPCIVFEGREGVQAQGSPRREAMGRCRQKRGSNRELGASIDVAAHATLSIGLEDLAH